MTQNSPESTKSQRKDYNPLRVKLRKIQTNASKELKTSSRTLLLSPLRTQKPEGGHTMAPHKRNPPTCKIPHPRATDHGIETDREMVLGVDVDAPHKHRKQLPSTLCKIKQGRETLHWGPSRPSSGGRKARKLFNSTTSKIQQTTDGQEQETHLTTCLP